MSIDNLKSCVVLSADPSITNCGIAVQLFEYNKVHLQSKVLHIETFRPKLKKTQDAYLNKFPSDKVLDSQILRAVMIYELVKGLCDKYNPSIIVAEAGFVQMNHSLAIISLVRVTQSIAMASRILGVPYLEYAPKKIKMCFQGHGASDKDGMRAALDNAIQCGQIQLPDTVNIEELSEHAIDSIAIGYTHILLNRDT